MKSLVFSLWVLLAVLVHAGDGYSSLGRESRGHLDRLAKLRPGFSWEQVRALYPEISEPLKGNDTFHRDCTYAYCPEVAIAGEQWDTRFYFFDGKLRGAELSMIENADRENRISRADARILKRTVMRHFADRFGARTEMEVPLLECPAGNPYALRKTWSWKTHVLAVDYDAHSNTGTVKVTMWEPKDWDVEHKKQLEEHWPLKPA